MKRSHGGLHMEHYVRADDESADGPTAAPGPAGDATARASFLQRITGLLKLVVADKRPPRPPTANYLPNSSGDGGKVISSGHPGGGGG